MTQGTFATSSWDWYRNQEMMGLGLMWMCLISLRSWWPESWTLLWARWMYVWDWILKVSTESSWNHCFVFIPIMTACNQPALPSRKGSETEDDKVAFPVVRPLCHLLTSVPDYCHCHYGLHWDITGKTQGLSCLLVSQQQATFLWAKNISFFDMRVYVCVCVLRKENENTYSGKNFNW